ncbi:hypothetical protein Aros01_06078 [Streptosporangium roseum]|uniref:Uncharacterized protein n=1 Tax=Streptosporangium roseum (strain ATCC 12428 / DSM 43021 / JCM 3005 / KCTC 9067 / NCIMB 10171 / NRRL 2505 / NI 9100) TaxID=479432 RepID=D2AQC7_STRRD|nr:hypothetical protein Sros_1478 [Streptosporangium roseum DSM 43021]
MMTTGWVGARSYRLNQRVVSGRNSKRSTKTANAKPTTMTLVRPDRTNVP